MSTPIILSDNLFDNVVLHPLATLVNPDGDDAPRHEPFRVADNQRDATWWTPTTTNATRRLRLTGLTAITPSMIFIDRGSNLAGATVRIQSSTDNFATVTTDEVVPVIPASPGGLASDANGCLLPDGSWWKTFTISNSRTAWQFTVNAMGANIAPIITGLYLGVGYRFPTFLNAPGAYDYGFHLEYQDNKKSRWGVRVKTRPLMYRKIVIDAILDGADYAAFHTEVMRLMRYNQPWVYCHDDSDATGSSLLALTQIPDSMDYMPVVNPVHREIKFDLEEVAPAIVV